MKRNPVEYQFRPELNKIFGKGGVIQQTNPKYTQDMYEDAMNPLEG